MKPDEVARPDSPSRNAAVSPKPLTDKLRHLTNAAHPLRLPSHKAAEIIPLVVQEVIRCTQDLKYTVLGFKYYNGTHWEQVEDAEVGLFLREYALKIGCPPDKVTPYWGVEALIKQAKLDLFAYDAPSREVVNFLNGTLELSALTLREHRREDNLANVLPFKYTPEANAPKFMRFLAEIQPNNAMQTLVQEVVAMPLARVHTEKLPFFYGDGCNGKSVLLEVVTAVYGRDNVSGFTLENVTRTDGLHLASMAGKLVNISSENSQRIVESAKFKAYVSGEPLEVRKLYHNPTTSTDYPPSIIAANALPIVNDFSGGFFRRFLFIPFDVVIPPDRINPNLSKELMEELPGICNWIIEGVRRLRQNQRFSQVEESAKVLEEFRQESDPVYLFAAEKEYAPGDALQILLSKFYTEFHQWARDRGFAPPNIRNVSQRLRQLGFTVRKGTANKTHLWHGTAPQDGNDDLPF